MSIQRAVEHHFLSHLTEAEMELCPGAIPAATHLLTNSLNEHGGSLPEGAILFEVGYFSDDSAACRLTLGVCALWAAESREAEAAELMPILRDTYSGLAEQSDVSVLINVIAWLASCDLLTEEVTPALCNALLEVAGGGLGTLAEKAVDDGLVPFLSLFALTDGQLKLVPSLLLSSGESADPLARMGIIMGPDGGADVHKNKAPRARG